MKKLYYLPIVFLCCISITTIAQNPEWNYNANEIALINAIIPDFQVNENFDSTYQGEPSIATDNNGNFVITWRDSRNDYSDIYAQRYSSDGSSIGVNFKVNDDEGIANHYCPSISVNGGDSFTIVWIGQDEDNSHVYAQRYSSNGTALGSNFKVTDDNGHAWTGYPPFTAPSISSDCEASFVITWTDSRNDNTDIYAQLYSSNGSPIGLNFKVNDSEGTVSNFVPSVSKDCSGNFVITWDDVQNGEYTVYAKRYSSAGVALGTSFVVKNNESANYPLVSCDVSGNIVIVWAGIYAQRYSSDGSTIGETFNVIHSNRRNYEDFSISSDDSGNFVITWTDVRNNHTVINAQRYSSDGNAIGSIFIVPNISGRDQSSPDVKLWNGRIYTTWESDNGTDNDVWANVLDWDNPVGVEDNELMEIPSAFELNQNYPNPFNPSTTIKYSIPVAVNSEWSIVNLKIYDVLGRQVATLVNEQQLPGQYKVTWDAAGQASGVYFYRLTAGNYIDIKKMLLLK